MEAITKWFEDGCDFKEGVALYKNLPETKNKVLRALSRGKSSYTKSLLIKELRKAKASPTPISTKKTTFKEVVQQAKAKEPRTDQAVITKHRQTVTKTESLKKEYGGVKYAELPQKLRLRYRELGKLFYELCDLKFVLNDIPAKEEKQALQVQLQIEELDDQRMMIWREIDHWKKHRTVLPSEADQYNGLNSDELRTAKARLASNITRLEKRVEERYQKLFDLKDKADIRNTERAIARSEAKIHKYQLNILKINELL
jgi:hypothetical protein